MKKLYLDGLFFPKGLERKHPCMLIKKQLSLVSIFAVLCKHTLFSICDIKSMFNLIFSLYSVNIYVFLHA